MLVHRCTAHTKPTPMTTLATALSLLPLCSEGILAGEMKHGPLALVDEHMPILVVRTIYLDAVLPSAAVTSPIVTISQAMLGSLHHAIRECFILARMQSLSHPAVCRWSVTAFIAGRHQRRHVVQDAVGHRAAARARRAAHRHVQRRRQPKRAAAAPQVPHHRGAFRQFRRVCCNCHP